MEAGSDAEENCSYEVDDEEIARLLSEAGVSSSEDDSEEYDIQPSKKRRAEEDLPHAIESGEFEKIPLELFRNILKLLSSEDLSNCAKVCKYLRRASSEAALWRRLYYLRWGSTQITTSSKNPTSTEWKQLYFERDTAECMSSMHNVPREFRECYMQIQTAKRGQAPLPSQMLRDDLLIVDQSIADQVDAWRCSQNLSTNFAGNHKCVGTTCSYHQIGDVFICEKTGCAHVCGDACGEAVLVEDNYYVCTVSGLCFDTCVSEVEQEEDEERHQSGFAEEYPYVRAYYMGYSGYEIEEAITGCC